MSKIRAMFQSQKDLEVFYISDGIDNSENWWGKETLVYGVGHCDSL